MKVLDIQADEADRLHHKKRKPNPLTGFSSKNNIDMVNFVNFEACN